MAIWSHFDGWGFSVVLNLRFGFERHPSPPPLPQILMICHANHDLFGQKVQVIEVNKYDAYLDFIYPNNHYHDLS